MSLAKDRWRLYDGRYVLVQARHTSTVAATVHRSGRCRLPHGFHEAAKLVPTQGAVAIRALGWRLRVGLGCINFLRTRVLVRIVFGDKGQSPLSTVYLPSGNIGRA
jgi:hypothetical protein